MRVVVLGSGQDGGSPQLGFGPRAGPARTASSITVLADGSALLFDAAPDLRVQQRRLYEEQGYHTRSGRVFDAVFLTHGHMGHYTGLVHFGKEALAAQGIPVFGTGAMLAFLLQNEPWRSLFGDGCLHAELVEAGVPRKVGDLEITAIEVPHRGEFTDTVGWSIDRQVLYLPDIDSWEEWPQARRVVDRHAIALLDGTFFDDREPPGRSFADVPHPPIADTLQRFDGAKAEIVLTHLNWSNPAGHPGSAEAARCAASGFTVATDGLVLAA